MRLSARLAMAQSPSSTYSLARVIGCGHCVRRRLRRTLSEKQRSKRLLLMQFDLTFPDEFQRCSKARCKHGRLLRGIDHVMEKILVETAPILGQADHPLQRCPRLGERP